MTLDPSIYSGAFVVFEKVINKALEYDPGTHQALQNLGDCCIEVNMSQPAFTFYILSVKDKIKLQKSYENKSDCQVSGDLIDLIKLTQSGKHTTAQTNVNIQGNIGTLNQLSAIGKQLDIDWEQALSDAFGNIIGNQLSYVIKSGINHGGKAKAQAINFSGDYLSEELRVTPSKIELNDFYNDVDSLRSRSERIAAKVQALETRINPKKDSST